MNDNLLIALDRIKFYAQDALVTVTQVSYSAVLKLTASVSAGRECFRRLRVRRLHRLCCMYHDRS